MVGKKGVLFSLMIFILLSTVISLNVAISERAGTINEATTTANSFKAVSGKYDNIKNNMVVLSDNVYSQNMIERIIPFTYELDSNSFAFEMNFPLRLESIENYLESLNAFRVFLEDTNQSHEFDSIKVDINTLLPPSWGGTSDDLSFIMNPECMKISINDLNSVVIEFVCADYNYLSLRKQTITMAPVNHDFNSVQCSFNGAGSCLSEDFNSDNKLPYIDVIILDENCSSCNLPVNEVKGHFDPSMESSISINCQGATCVSKDFNLSFNNKTEIAFNGTRLATRIQLDLDSDVDEIVFNDLNLSVENTAFGVKKWN